MKNNKKYKSRIMFHERPSIFRFTPVSPTMLFRTIILTGTLVVATVAILRGVYDSNVWTFLGSIVVYTALTTGKSNVNQKKQ